MNPTRVMEVFEETASDIVSRLNSDKSFKIQHKLNYIQPKLLEQIYASVDTVDQVCWTYCLGALMPLTLSLCREAATRAWIYITQRMDYARPEEKANQITYGYLTWRNYCVFACATVSAKSDRMEAIETHYNRSARKAQKGNLGGTISGNPGVIAGPTPVELFNSLLKSIKLDIHSEAVVMALQRANYLEAEDRVYDDLFEAIKNVEADLIGAAKRKKKGGEEVFCRTSYIYSFISETIVKYKPGLFIRNQNLRHIFLGWIRFIKQFLTQVPATTSHLDSFKAIRVNFCNIIGNLALDLRSEPTLFDKNDRHSFFNFLMYWCKGEEYSSEESLKLKPNSQEAMQGQQEGEHKVAKEQIVQKSACLAAANLLLGPLFDEAESISATGPIFTWITRLFTNEQGKIYRQIGRTALENLLTGSILCRNTPNIALTGSGNHLGSGESGSGITLNQLIHTSGLAATVKLISICIDHCYLSHKIVSAGYFVGLVEFLKSNCVQAFPQHLIINLILYKSGDESPKIRSYALELLQVMCEKTSIIYEPISMSSNVSLTYQNTQYLLSDRIAEANTLLCFKFVNEVCNRLDQVPDEFKRDEMMGYLVPWLSRLDNLSRYYKTAYNGELEAFIEDMLIITLKYVDKHPGSVQKLWTTIALANDANVEIVVDVLLRYGTKKKNPGFLPLTKKIIIFFARTTPKTAIDCLVNELSTFTKNKTMSATQQAKKRFSFIAPAAAQNTERKLNQLLPDDPNGAPPPRGHFALMLLSELGFEFGVHFKPHLAVILHQIFLGLDNQYLYEHCTVMLLNLVHALIIVPIELWERKKQIGADKVYHRLSLFCLKDRFSSIGSEVRYDPKLDLGLNATASASSESLNSGSNSSNPNTPAERSAPGSGITPSPRHGSGTTTSSSSSNSNSPRLSHSTGGTTSAERITANNNEEGITELSTFQDSDQFPQEAYEDALELKDYLKSKKDRLPYEDVSASKLEINSAKELYNLVQRVKQIFSHFAGLIETWSLEALSWALSCPSIHLSARSFQIYRSLLPFNFPLNRLTPIDILEKVATTWCLGNSFGPLNTSTSFLVGSISDKGNSPAGFGGIYDSIVFTLEALTTITAMVESVDTIALWLYYIFWSAIALLETEWEAVYYHALLLICKLFERFNFADSATQNLFLNRVPTVWKSSNQSLTALVTRGMCSNVSELKSIDLLTRTINLKCEPLLGSDSDRLCHGSIALFVWIISCTSVSGAGIKFVPISIPGLQTLTNSVILNLAEGIRKTFARNGKEVEEFTQFLTTLVDKVWSSFEQFCDEFAKSYTHLFFSPPIKTDNADKVFEFLFNLLEKGLPRYHKGALNLIKSLMKASPALGANFVGTSTTLPIVHLPFLSKISTSQHPLWKDGLSTLSMIIASSKNSKIQKFPITVLPSYTEKREFSERPSSSSGVEQNKPETKGSDSTPSTSPSKTNTAATTENKTQDANKGNSTSSASSSVNKATKVTKMLQEVNSVNSNPQTNNVSVEFFENFFSLFTNDDELVISLPNASGVSPINTLNLSDSGAGTGLNLTPRLTGSMGREASISELEVSSSSTNSKGNLSSSKGNNSNSYNNSLKKAEEDDSDDSDLEDFADIFQFSNRSGPAPPVNNNPLLGLEGIGSSYTLSVGSGMSTIEGAIVRNEQNNNASGGEHIRDRSLSADDLAIGSEIMRISQIFNRLLTQKRFSSDHELFEIFTVASQLLPLLRDDYKNTFNDVVTVLSSDYKDKIEASDSKAVLKADELSQSLFAMVGAKNKNQVLFTILVNAYTTAVEKDWEFPAKFKEKREKLLEQFSVKQRLFVEQKVELDNLLGKKKGDGNSGERDEKTLCQALVQLNYYLLQLYEINVSLQELLNTVHEGERGKNNLRRHIGGKEAPDSNEKKQREKLKSEITRNRTLFDIMIKK